MDVQMPVMDGLEATRAIRQGKTGQSNKNIPIVAVTANAMEAHKASYLKAGMNAYVSKPLEKKSLLQAMVSAIEQGDSLGFHRPEQT